MVKNEKCRYKINIIRGYDKSEDEELLELARILREACGRDFAAGTFDWTPRILLYRFNGKESDLCAQQDCCCRTYGSISPLNTIEHVPGNERGG